MAKRETKTSSAKRKKSPSERSGLVQSLSRGLGLLEALAENDDGLRLVDVAARVELAPSTAHRLLTTLEQRQFVYLDKQTGHWQVGVRCFSVGNAFLQRRNLVVQSYPLLKRLRDDSGETVNLGIENEGDLVFLAQVESRELMRAISRPGGRTPMHCSGMGKALLAALPEDEAQAIIRDKGLARFTPHTIVTTEEFGVERTRMRDAGWSFDNEEHAMGLRCVAAAIFDELAQPIAAISLSGPTVRLPDERIPRLADLVKSAAHDITLSLGGRLPHEKGRL